MKSRTAGATLCIKRACAALGLEIRGCAISRVVFGRRMTRGGQPGPISQSNIPVSARAGTSQKSKLTSASDRISVGWWRADRCALLPEWLAMAHCASNGQRGGSTAASRGSQPKVRHRDECRYGASDVRPPFQRKPVGRISVPSRARILSFQVSFQTAVRSCAQGNTGCSSDSKTR
jgi:hypothetical protein